MSIAVFSSLEPRRLMAIAESSLFMREGILSIIGTSGDDTLKVTVTSPHVTATLNGVEKKFLGVRKLSINALWGNDLIDVAISHRRGLILGHEGNDTIIGGRGPETISGGPGDDLLVDGDLQQAYGISDTLSGADGNDTLIDGFGNDSLQGGRGNDLLEDGGGRDRLEGHLGADTIVGHAGADENIYDGGSGGEDTVSFAEAYVSLRYTFTGVRDQYPGGSHTALHLRGTVNARNGERIASLVNITNVIAGDRGDAIDANFEGVSKHAQGKSEIIYRTLRIDSGGGNDQITYNGANPFESAMIAVTLKGGSGADVVNSRSHVLPAFDLGAGDDQFLQSSAAYFDETISSFGDGSDLFSGRVGDNFTFPADLEAASLSTTPTATVTGNALDNLIAVSSSAAAVLGGDGDDRMSVGPAKNIDGGAGHDRIDVIAVPGVYFTEPFIVSGDAGNDRIRVSVGQTVGIYGDEGNDSILSDVYATLNGGTGVDRITQRGTAGAVELLDGERDMYFGYYGAHALDRDADDVVVMR